MKNIRTTPELFLTIAETVCDRCGVVMPSESVEFSEAMSINQLCGQ